MGRRSSQHVQQALAASVPTPNPSASFTTGNVSRQFGFGLGDRVHDDCGTIWVQMPHLWSSPHRTGRQIVPTQIMTCRLISELVI